MRPAVLFLILLLSFSGCRSLPFLQSIESRIAGEKAADTAQSMIGSPYRSGGASPDGFDCSGLVQYSFSVAGMQAPHGTRELRKATRPVERAESRKGDLLFFAERGRDYSHVGIYLEKNLFIHAPATGGTVRLDSLRDPYWGKRYQETRRFP